MLPKVLPESPIGAPVRERPLEAWERDALAKLRLLRQSKKAGILLMAENGAIQVYAGVRAGVIPP